MQIANPFVFFKRFLTAGKCNEMLEN
jgi:hypothetical protein